MEQVAVEMVEDQMDLMELMEQQTLAVVLEVVNGKVYKNAVLAMTGPRRPWGNIANIFEYGGTIKLWGPWEGNPKPQTRRLKPNKFLRYAADTTIAEQRAAFVAQVKKRWRKL